MTSQITVPKPCNEDWNKMSIQEQGRFCGSCEKIVMDFTSWDTDEIAWYLRQNATVKICGRFSSDQLKQESISNINTFLRAIVAIPTSFLKKAAAILLFAFVLQPADAQVHPVVVGKIAAPVATHQPIKHPTPPTLGAPMMVTPKDTTGKKVKQPTKKTICADKPRGADSQIRPARLLMGEPAVADPDKKTDGKKPLPVIMGMVARAKPRPGN